MAYGGFLVVERCRTCGYCEAAAASASELLRWRTKTTTEVRKENIPNLDDFSGILHSLDDSIKALDTWCSYIEARWRRISDAFRRCGAFRGELMTDSSLVSWLSRAEAIAADMKDTSPAPSMHWAGHAMDGKKCDTSHDRSHTGIEPPLTRHTNSERNEGLLKQAHSSAEVVSDFAGIEQQQKELMTVAGMTFTPSSSVEAAGTATSVIKAASTCFASVDSVPEPKSAAASSHDVEEAVCRKEKTEDKSCVVEEETAQKKGNNQAKHEVKKDIKKEKSCQGSETRKIDNLRGTTATKVQTGEKPDPKTAEGRRAPQSSAPRRGKSRHEGAEPSNDLHCMLADILRGQRDGRPLKELHEARDRLRSIERKTGCNDSLSSTATHSLGLFN